jgi:hypothetical protein
MGSIPRAGIGNFSQIEDIAVAHPALKPSKSIAPRRMGLILYQALSRSVCGVFMVAFIKRLSFI